MVSTVIVLQDCIFVRRKRFRRAEVRGRCEGSMEDEWSRTGLRLATKILT